jgi:hypothetical protein
MDNATEKIKFLMKKCEKALLPALLRGDYSLPKRKKTAPHFFLF